MKQFIKGFLKLLLVIPVFIVEIIFLMVDMVFIMIANLYDFIMELGEDE